MLGGVVMTRERSGPLSTSPICENRQAQLLLCPANCSCKISLRKNPGSSRIMGSEVEMQNSFPTCLLPMAKSSHSSERQRQYGLGTTSVSSKGSKIAEKQNATESHVQKFQFYVSGSNPKNQCHLHVVPCLVRCRAGPVYEYHLIPPTFAAKSIWIERRGAIRESHMLQARPKHRVRVHHCASNAARRRWQRPYHCQPRRGCSIMCETWSPARWIHWISVYWLIKSEHLKKIFECECCFHVGLCQPHGQKSMLERFEAAPKQFFPGMRKLRVGTLVTA